MTFRGRVSNLAWAMLVVLVLLTTRLVYWQMIRGQDLQPVALDPVAAAAEASRLSEPQAGSGRLDYLVGNEARELQPIPQPVIQRTTELLRRITRGSIFDRNGRVLAYERVGEDGTRSRFYNEPAFAPVLGYVSGIRTGVVGLENTFNDTLLGLDRLDAQLGRLINQPVVGSDLVLTLDSEIQRAAEEALEGRAGAVVVLDGHSGAILAMASLPRYDPNRMLEQGYIVELLQPCAANPNCQSPLINRASQALYVPGSTFKTVVLAAALDIDQVQPETEFIFQDKMSGPEGEYWVYRTGGGVIPDPNHPEDHLDLGMAYAKSANAAFGMIGDQMPAEQLVEYARRFGFSSASGSAYRLEIDTSTSSLAQDLDQLFNNDLLQAATAIGQGELLATPLDMARVVLPALNEGRMPAPYLVEAVRQPNGRISRGPYSRGDWQRVIEAETARTVHEMMITSVQQGGGQNAAIPGYTVGGKTGTAQLGGEAEPHAWFMGYVEAGEKAVAIAVVVENGGSGFEVAAPIFAKVGKVAMEQLGEPSDQELPELPPPPTPLPQEEPEELAEAPTPTATQPPQEPEQTQAPTPTASPTAVAGMEPEILHDPAKRDIGEGEATCPGEYETVTGTGAFTWPSQYQAISGGKFEEGHPGLDLSAPPGSPVYAADAGRVIFAGWTDLGYGNAVLIDHGNGYRTLYAHLSQVSTYCGQKVAQGKIIGLSGDTGNSYGPHLHFEVRVPGGWINPSRVLPTP